MSSFLPGKMTRAFVVRCYDCAAETTYFTNHIRVGAGATKSMAAKWARDDGWGKRAGLWRCPRHRT